MLYYLIKSLPDQMKSARMKPIGFASCWPCDPRQDQGQWTWYKMVDANGVYKHDRYENIWLYTLHVMSNIKVFAMRDSQQVGWPDEHTHTAHDIDPWYSYGSKRELSPMEKYLLPFLSTKKQVLHVTTDHCIAKHIFNTPAFSWHLSYPNCVKTHLSLLSAGICHIPTVWRDKCHSWP